MPLSSARQPLGTDEYAMELAGHPAGLADVPHDADVRGEVKVMDVDATFTKKVL